MLVFTLIMLTLVLPVIVLIAAVGLRLTQSDKDVSVHSLGGFNLSRFDLEKQAENWDAFKLCLCSDVPALRFWSWLSLVSMLLLVLCGMICYTALWYATNAASKKAPPNPQTHTLPLGRFGVSFGTGRSAKTE